MELTIVYCTKESNPDHKEHLIKSSGLHKHVEVIELINDGVSLTEMYNEGLKRASSDKIVFTHDDVSIETKQWGKKLLKTFNKNPHGIIGVAGTKHLTETGRWWDDRKMMCGRVKHTSEGKSWLSEYSDDLGKEVEDVVVVDGVFFAVDKNKIKKGFDETVEGFHFYDIDFCFQNYLEGVKVGVITSIRVNHKSIGETDDKWEDNRVKFANKYKKELPIKLTETFKNRKLKVLFIVNNKSEDLTDTIKLCGELNNNGCVVGLVSNYTNKDILLGGRNKVKLYTMQEPPGYKLGDGNFHIKTQNGTQKSEKGKLYRVKPLKYDIIYTTNQELLELYRKIYPEGKFIKIGSDKHITNNNDISEYKEFFIKTFNYG